MMFEKEPGKPPRAKPPQAVPCPLPLVIEAEGIEEVSSPRRQGFRVLPDTDDVVAMATPPFWC